jgi:transposase-like protein DUF772
VSSSLAIFRPDVPGQARHVRLLVIPANEAVAKRWHGFCGTNLRAGSLRGLERRVRTDLGSMWLWGGITPDHSSLGRFIVRHAELLSEEFFEQLRMEVL